MTNPLLPLLFQARSVRFSSVSMLQPPFFCLSLLAVVCPFSSFFPSYKQNTLCILKSQVLILYIVYTFFPLYSSLLQYLLKSQRWRRSTPVNIGCFSAPSPSEGFQHRGISPFWASVTARLPTPDGVKTAYCCPATDRVSGLPSYNRILATRPPTYAAVLPAGQTDTARPK